MLNSEVFSSVYNFIVNFKPSEIDEIIEDVEFVSAGGKILYALDTYDIIAHYLPFTEDSFFQHDNKNLLAQKLICYDFFFNPDSKKNLIILDEYKIELLATKNRIDKQLRDANSIVKNLRDLKNETKQFTEMLTGAEEFFDKHFELILLLLILNEKKDFIHMEFNTFLTKKLTIFNIDSGSESGDNYLDKLFSETNSTELTEKIFNEFVEINKFELVSIDKPTERYVYLENTFRDVQAVDRVLELNKKLSADNKFKVIYLSSTPFKTPEIFRCVKSVTNRQYPLGLSKINVHRNIFQCFLFDVLNEQQNDESPALDVLRSLKRITEQLSLKKNEKMPGELLIGREDEFALIKIKSIFDLHSSNLDNHFYMKVYEKYKSLYQAFNNKGRKDKASTYSGQVDVLKLFKQIDDFLVKEKFQEKIRSYDYSISRINQALQVAKKLGIHTSLTPNIQFGSDVIKNNLHHLPYLIFLRIPIESSLKNALYQFLERLIGISHPDHSLIEELQNYIRNIINEFSEENKNIAILSLQEICISFINLVTLPVSGTPGKDLENDIIKSLEKQKTLFEYVAVEAVLESKNDQLLLSVVNTQSNYADEIDYLLLWLYRRNGRIDDGILLGELQIKKNDNDPRFYHGLALCYIAKAYLSIFPEQQPELRFLPQEVIFHLTKASANLLRSKTLYQNELTNSFNLDFKVLLRKNLLAVINSMADISIRKYQFTDNLEDLETAKRFIKELRDQTVLYGMEFTDSAVFTVTEIEIEYREAKMNFEQGKANEASAILIDIQIRFATLKKIKQFSHVHKGFRKIESEINELFAMVYSTIARTNK